MTWSIEFSSEAEKVLSKLDRSVEKRILKFLHSRVANHPDPVSLSEPLSGRLGPYRRFRVGNYRIICQFQKEKMVVLVVTLGHRSSIYQ